jgi:hypothetical protein
MLAIVLVAVLISCKKEDEFQVENKPVIGTVDYTQTGFVPLEVDPVTQQPLKARISFSGSGNITEIGDITLESSFTFDFVAGQGSDFETTYTGADPGDTFSSGGTSQMTGNMVFEITENFISGTGKFKKIKGGGGIHVELLPDGSAGTGDVSWTVTF